MSSQLQTHLRRVGSDDARNFLNRLGRGIEKESLRVLPDGELSHRPHFMSLGSALTHPHITTDFSESQLELITNVHHSPETVLEELIDVHRYVYQHIDDELLWASSMPCILGRANDIPVGQYGTSNIGRTKTIYRRGLGIRYGRLMQTISGIHYNFSLPEALWPIVAEARGFEDSQDFRTRAYFDLIRNFRRHSWLLILLFGASPAICKSFVSGRKHNLEPIGEGSLHLPFATSLRMGGLGYQSDAQSELHVSYNSFRQYAETMRSALTSPYPEYERLGVMADGKHQQLNACLIQIENEFYGTIRPKRRILPGERPLQALDQRGVEYIEVRCLDLNPFCPVGIDETEIRFLDTFLLHCLFTESPLDSPAESLEIVDNQKTVVERGRQPGITLKKGGVAVALGDWSSQLLNECRGIADLLDSAEGADDFQAALQQQVDTLEDLNKSPSARILQTMEHENIPFFRFAMNQSLKHKETFASCPLEESKRTYFDRLTRESLQKQSDIEASDELPFEEFLAEYLKVPELSIHQ